MQPRYDRPYLRLAVAVSEAGQGDIAPVSRFPGVTHGRLLAFCEAVAVVTGVEVRALELEHYRDLERALHDRRVDLLWAPPLVALHLIRRDEVLPLVVPVRGSHGSYSAALFTRVGSPFDRLDRLVAARAAWVDPYSAAGYVVIRAELVRRGIDPWMSFQDEQFLGSHEEVVRQVLAGTVDVGATYLERDGDRIRAAGWGRQPVRVLLEAGPVPSDMLLAAPDLELDLAHQIRELLVSNRSEAAAAAARELFDADAFEPARLEHLTQLGDQLGALDGIPLRPIP